MRAFAVIAIAAIAAYASDALACKPLPWPGANNKAVEALYAKQRANEAFTEKEQALWDELQTDKQTYDELVKKTWPVCSERGATDCYPGCSELSAEELAKAPYMEDGAHYRVSPGEFPALKQQKQQLLEKWNNKQ